MAQQAPVKVGNKKRTLDAQPDSLDFRDRMFVPTLKEVATRIDLAAYQSRNVPILDQGVEGACTGFGLATIANFLLGTRKPVPDSAPVSPRMLYEMAKRYDEWPGEEYSGSSARGAMKGWHSHGVCAETLWKYEARKSDRELTPRRAEDAVNRPLGAYFRVNHRDLVAMHCALAEVGALYATGIVHDGWGRVDRDGMIPYTNERSGGHAFAIVAYDENGFWIQNSWGDDWGVGGFALITYDDWLENGTDVWVARLGVPVRLLRPASTAAANSDSATDAASYTFHELRPHIISIGNNGVLRETGTYGTSEKAVETLLLEDFPRITKDWPIKRLLIYAHGGLTDEASAIQRVADYRKVLLNAQVYPLAFIWKSDFWTTLTNILQDALSRRRSEGLLDATKDFMLNRLDDALEPLARMLGGKSQWDEMQENATLATKSTQGGARKMLKYLAALLKAEPKLELHVVGHSAGAIFHAPLIQMLTASGTIKDGPMKGKTGLGRTVETCTLWAPASTTALFKETYLPAIKANRIKNFGLFTLTDQIEQDDHCANIYNKSLLYLVSHAFERQPRIPFIQDGVPILGMQASIEDDADLKKLFKTKTAEWILAPNTAPPGPRQSTALHHGDFDDDQATLRATLARILGSSKSQADLTVHASSKKLRQCRVQLQQGNTRLA